MRTCAGGSRVRAALRSGAALRSVGSDQQLQFLQVHGLQRQPPFVQLQVQAAAFFSIVLSMVGFPFDEGVDSRSVEGV